MRFRLLPAAQGLICPADKIVHLRAPSSRFIRSLDQGQELFQGRLILLLLKVLLPQQQAGVNRIPDLSDPVADRIAERIHTIRAPADLVLLSIHWGGNWGYAIPDVHRRFAHRLIDSGAIDAVHGHSSHHPLGIEVHRGRPILYGCGDLLNDYEGIGGYDWLRPDLGLMYFTTHAVGSGQLLRLEAVPMRIERLRLNRATRREAEWLAERLARESKRFGVSVTLGDDDALRLSW